jgi:hypothetical protein
VAFENRVPGCGIVIDGDMESPLLLMFSGSLNLLRYVLRYVIHLAPDSHCMMRSGGYRFSLRVSKETAALLMDGKERSLVSIYWQDLICVDETVMYIHRYVLS